MAKISIMERLCNILHSFLPITCLYTQADILGYKKEIEALEKRLTEAEERGLQLWQCLKIVHRQAEEAKAASAVEIARLESLSTTDTLTGLLNRRGEEEIVENDLHVIQRSGKEGDLKIAMSVIALDLDRFKVVNDTFGHAAGDMVLRTVAEILLSIFHRKTDKICRTGGDEFLVVLLDATEKQAEALASKLVEAINQDQRLVFGGIRVTASIGIAAIDTRHHDATAAYQTAVHRADEALYTAKSAGRNVVRIAA